MPDDENEGNDDVYLSLRVSKDLDDKIKRVKEDENFNTKSELLRFAIREYLNNRRIDRLEEKVQENREEIENLKGLFKPD